MIASGTANQKEWNRMRASKREWFLFHNEIKYEVYNYNIFSNIDYLKIGKLMTCSVNIIFCISITQLFRHVFAITFVEIY